MSNFLHFYLPKIPCCFSWHILSTFSFLHLFNFFNISFLGPGSSVSIATAYQLDGPGIKSRFGEIIRSSPDRPWSPSILLYNGYRFFPGGNLRPWRDADTSPHLVPRWKIDYNYTSILPKGLCGLLKVEIYLITPYFLRMDRNGIFCPFTKYNLDTHLLTDWPAPNLPFTVQLCTKFPYFYHF